MASNFSCNSLTCQIDGRIDPVSEGDAGQPAARNRRCLHCKARHSDGNCPKGRRSRRNTGGNTPETTTTPTEVIVPVVTQTPTPTPVLSRNPEPPPAPLTVSVRQPSPTTQIPQTMQPVPTPVTPTATIVPSKQVGPETTIPLTRETPKPFVPQTPFVPLQLTLPETPVTPRPPYCNDPRFAGTELCAPDAVPLSGYCADKLASLGSLDALSHEELCQTEAARYMHATAPAAPTAAASTAATTASMLAKADPVLAAPLDAKAAGAVYAQNLAGCLAAFELLSAEGQAEVIEGCGAQKAISDQTAMDLRRGVPSAANAWLRFFAETYPENSPQAQRFCALVNARVGVSAAGSVYVQSSRPYVTPRRPAGAVMSMEYPNAAFAPGMVPAGDDTALRQCFAMLRSMPVSVVQAAVRANIRQMPTTTPLGTYLGEFVSANGLQRAEAARTAWVNAMSTAHWANRLSAPSLSDAVRSAVLGLCATFKVAPSAGPFSVGAMQKINPQAAYMLGANFGRAAGAPIPAGWTKCGMMESDITRSAAILRSASPIAIARAYAALDGQVSAALVTLAPMRALAAQFLQNPTPMNRDAFISAAYGYLWSDRQSNEGRARALTLALTDLAKSVERGAQATNPAGYAGADQDVDSCLVQLSAVPPRALGEAIRRTQRIVAGFGNDNMTRSALTSLYGSDGEGIRDQYVAWLRSSTPDVILTLCQQAAAVVGGIAPAGAPADAALFLTDADAQRAFARLPVGDQVFILRGTAFRGLSYPAMLADALSRGVMQLQGVSIPALLGGYMDARLTPSDARRTLYRAAVTDAAYRNGFLQPAGLTAADAPRVPPPATPKPGTTPARPGTTTRPGTATGGTQGRPGTPATPDATQIPPGFTAAQWADIVHNHPDVAAQLVTALANQPSTFTQVATQLLAATNTVLAGIHQGEVDARASDQARLDQQVALARIALERQQAEAQAAQRALDPTLQAPAPAPVQYVQPPPPSTTTTTTNTGLSTGAMVGIGAGVVGVGALAAFALKSKSGGRGGSKQNRYHRQTKKGNVRASAR